MEETIVMFKECLFQSFYDWLLRHREMIGDKHYGKLFDDLKKAWDLSDTPVKLIGIAMWIFNMIANLGVLAGLGPAKVDLQVLPEKYDEKLTRRVLLNCSCLCLQYLPKEISTEKVTRGNAPWRFRLADYIAAQHQFLGCEIE